MLLSVNLIIKSFGVKSSTPAMSSVAQVVLNEMDKVSPSFL